MSTSPYRVRRATVDDLGSLLPLWDAMRFSASELERCLTDFQVVEGPDGRVLGAIAIEICGHHARLHSEAFLDFALADELRELIWHRLQTFSSNHALGRLWTHEGAPFWRQAGFRPPGADETAKLPAKWRPLPPQWLTLALRAEEALEIASGAKLSESIDTQFVQFRAAEQANRDRLLRRAQLVQNFAALIAIILAIFVITVLVSYVFKNPRLLGR